MSIPTRFLALSAVYFGLASAVTPQPTTAQTVTQTSDSSRRSTWPGDARNPIDRAFPSRQREFDHPLNDPRVRNGSRRDREEENYRRGAQGADQDRATQQRSRREVQRERNEQQLRGAQGPSEGN
jgi:hypothetical protein